MFDQKKLSTTERARVLDYLIFKLRHGGNVVTALKSYMDGNKAKASRPVQEMLDRIAAGANFVDVALAFGLVDRYGHLILSSSVEPAKALPVIRDSAISSNFGVSAIIIKDVLKKWGAALVVGLTLLSDAGRKPLVEIFEKINQTAAATGAVADPLPIYLAQPWLVTGWVLATGVGLLLSGAALWWTNKHNTGLMYRMAKFRFYEDWTGLLALYLAFKTAGQSDYKAAQSLAAACPEGGFTQKLFADMGDAMRQRGRSFYDVLAEHEGAIPPAVLSFFMDAAKTGQIDAYILQAKEYCDFKLARITEATKLWVPALSGVVMLLVFGLMIADLFIKLSTGLMKPLSG